MRVGRDHDQVSLIGLPEDRVGRLLQQKIDQTIVDDVHTNAAERQRITFELQIARIADQDLESDRPQLGLGEPELWIQRLRHGIVIQDGNRCRRPTPVLQPPLIAEHLSDVLLKRCRLGSVNAGDDPRAARLLRPGENGVQEGTSGVGVDLDELGADGCHVEVVTHEGTQRTRIPTRERRGPGQGRFAIGGQHDSRLSRRHHVHHPAERLCGQENGGPREQPGMGFSEVPGEPGDIRLAIECGREGCLIHPHAKAAAVQLVCAYGAGQGRQIRHQ